MAPAIPWYLFREKIKDGFVLLRYSQADCDIYLNRWAQRLQKDKKSV